MPIYIQPANREDLPPILDRLNQKGITTSTDLSIPEIYILPENEFKKESIEEWLKGFDVHVYEGVSWSEKYKN